MPSRLEEPLPSLLGRRWPTSLRELSKLTLLVMVVTNDQGMQHLLSSKFKIGADASAAAGPVGRDAGADTDWKMKAEVLTYSRARGVFAGVDPSGSSITQDKDERQILYGRWHALRTF